VSPSRGSSTSEAVTNGVRVRVRARYAAEHSQPHLNRWFFLYTVEITNESDETVQLISRHRIIADATEKVEEVRGEGVVGEQPVLEPGDCFEYTSGCPLPTPFGSMHGTYQMVTEGGGSFDVEIARFALAEPGALH
jgi:ApaG protein